MAGVRTRLLGDNCTVDTTRLHELLDNENGIDRLESFGAKFGRMQDTVVDKLIPAALKAAGEPDKAAIDNLKRMERFSLIVSADEWLEMRGLRNRLVHEYIDKPENLAHALQHACQFIDSMHADYAKIRGCAVKNLRIEKPTEN